MLPIFAETLIWPTHDRSVSIGDWSFGVVSYNDHSFIYFGPFSTETSYSAPTILAVSVAALLALMLTTAYLITHFRAKPDKGN